MDNVERLIAEIENDREIMSTKFSGLADDTANVLEKYGFGVAKAFLMEKQSHKNLRVQAGTLLKVLEKVERYPAITSDRKTVRLIIKAVDALRFKRRR